MENSLICNSCHEKNPFYALNCTKCNAFLRAKISNIDLWHTTWKIFESPVRTAENIIQADHKNFVFVLLFLICLKYSFLKAMIFNAVTGREVLGNLSGSILNGGIPLVIGLLAFSLVMTLANKSGGIQNRFRDNVAIYTYSFIPQLLGMLFLVPIHFALFGEYWFTFNPSPFIIKPAAATLLMLIDALLFIWSMFNISTATYAQTKNKIYSVLSAVLVIVLIGIILLFLPVIFEN